MSAMTAFRITVVSIRRNLTACPAADIPKGPEFILRAWISAIVYLIMRITSCHNRSHNHSHNRSSRVRLNSCR